MNNPDKPQSSGCLALGGVDDNQISNKIGLEIPWNTELLLIAPGEFRINDNRPSLP